MSKTPKFPAVIISTGEPSEATFAQMNAATNNWTARAARGECGWMCSDCCQSFPNGMPDECCYGHQSCTDIIARDKRAASQVTEERV